MALNIKKKEKRGERRVNVLFTWTGREKRGLGAPFCELANMKWPTSQMI